MSGSTDEGVNIVALVQAKEPENASAAIIAEWPELKKLIRKKGFTWRFFQTKDADFKPGDRFVLSQWMRDRLETNKGA